MNQITIIIISLLLTSCGTVNRAKTKNIINKRGSDSEIIKKRLSQNENAKELRVWLHGTNISEEAFFQGGYITINLEN